MSHNLNRVVFLSLLITGCGGGSGSSNEANVSAPNLTEVNEKLYELNKPIASVVFSNSGGGDLTACGINPTVGGITVEVADNKKDCVLSGTPSQSQVGVAHSVTATNRSGSDSVPFIINVIPQPELALALTPAKRFDFSWAAIDDINHYRLYENSDGLSGFTLVDRLSASDTSYSHQVALYQRLNGQYTLEVCVSSDETQCISSETVSVTGNMTDGIGQLIGSYSDDNDKLGSGIALSQDGTVMALGSMGDDSATTGINSDGSNNDAEDAGAVYIFENDGDRWTQTAYIKAHNADAGDEFGRRVALSHDGNTLAVTSPREASSSVGIDGVATLNDSSESGAVYVFARGNETWSQQAYIKSSNSERKDHFGRAISLSGNGDKLAVTARWEDGGIGGVNGDESNNDVSASGAVYVFERSGDTWSQQTYLKASTPIAGDNLGEAVALSADGATLAVSAPKQEDSDGVENIGAVYVFVEDNDVWQQQAIIRPTTSHAGFPAFGWRIAISDNGNDLAITSHNDPSSATGVDGDETDSNAARSGSVFVFTRVDGVWNQQAYLKAHNTDADDFFGTDLEMSGDGDLLVISAHGESSSVQGITNSDDNNDTRSSGAVYVFKRNGGTWSQSVYIKSPTPTENAFFGGIVGLSDDGQVLGVMSIREHNGNGFYLY